MRLIGRILMAFGGFFLSIAIAAVLEPWLRSLGIDIRVETTSVIGTALIGAFAFSTGVLMRRRGSEAALARGAAARQLGEGEAEVPFVRAREKVEERRR